MIIAIESAIDGGSLSLVDRDVEIASWIGDDAQRLRAGSLITNIENLLNSAGIEKASLRMIVVSAGPGSFTGIRIGLATALGLKTALGIPVHGVSALDAMAFAHGHTGVVAIPMGRGGAAAQRFVNGIADGSPFSVSAADVFHLEPHGNFLAHEKLVAAAEGHRPIVNFGSNIASALAMFAGRNEPVSHAPIFISKTV